MNRDDIIWAEYVVYARGMGNRLHGTPVLTYEEWLEKQLFAARLEVEVRGQFDADNEKIYLAYQPPVTRFLVRLVVNTVDWAQEAGYKVRRILRPGRHEVPF